MRLAQSAGSLLLIGSHGLLLVQAAFTNFSFNAVAQPCEGQWIYDCVAPQQFCAHDNVTGINYCCDSILQGGPHAVCWTRTPSATTTCESNMFSCSTYCCLKDLQICTETANQWDVCWSTIEDPYHELDQAVVNATFSSLAAASPGAATLNFDLDALLPASTSTSSTSTASSTRSITSTIAATTTSSSAASTVASSVVTVTATSSPSPSSVSAGGIGGGIAAGVVVIALLALVGYLLRRRRRRQQVKYGAIGPSPMTSHDATADHSTPWETSPQQWSANTAAAGPVPYEMSSDRQLHEVSSERPTHELSGFHSIHELSATPIMQEMYTPTTR